MERLSVIEQKCMQSLNDLQQRVEKLELQTSETLTSHSNEIIRLDEQLEQNEIAFFNEHLIIVSERCDYLERNNLATDPVLLEYHN